MVAEGEEKTAIPAGCVERRLNMYDRRLIMQAVVVYLGKDNRNDIKGANKKERIRKLLNYSDVEEYFDLLSDSYSERVESWNDAWKRYNDAKKAGSPLPDKPPRKAPEPMDEELRGPESKFHIPSKLDVLILDAIKAMQWDLNLSKFVEELREKLGLPADD